MNDAERDRIRALRWQLKRQDTPARRQRCRPRSTSKEAERKRLARAGMIALTIWVNRLWAAEALAVAGYMHADNDSREAVQHALQEHVDDMIRAAGGDVPPGTSGEA